MGLSRTRQVRPTGHPGWADHVEGEQGRSFAVDGCGDFGAEAAGLGVQLGQDRVVVELLFRQVGPGDHEEPRRVRRRHDGEDVQALKRLVAALAGEDHVEGFGHLAAKLFCLAAFFRISGREGINGDSVVE